MGAKCCCSPPSPAEKNFSTKSSSDPRDAICLKLTHFEDDSDHWPAHTDGAVCACLWAQQLRKRNPSDSLTTRGWRKEPVNTARPLRSRNSSGAWEVHQNHASWIKADCAGLQPMCCYGFTHLPPSSPDTTHISHIFPTNTLWSLSDPSETTNKLFDHHYHHHNTRKSIFTSNYSIINERYRDRLPLNCDSQAGGVTSSCHSRCCCCCWVLPRWEETTFRYCCLKQIKRCSLLQHNKQHYIVSTWFTSELLWKYSTHMCTFLHFPTNIPSVGLLMRFTVQHFLPASLVCVLFGDHVTPIIFWFSEACRGAPRPVWKHHLLCFSFNSSAAGSQFYWGDVCPAH